MFAEEEADFDYDRHCQLTFLFPCVDEDEAPAQLAEASEQSEAIVIVAWKSLFSDTLADIVKLGPVKNHHLEKYCRAFLLGRHKMYLAWRQRLADDREAPPHAECVYNAHILFEHSAEEC